MRTFLRPHLIAFYAGLLDLSDEHDRLKAIAGYILTHKPKRMNSREVQKAVRSMRKLGAREVTSIMEQLEAFGWLFRHPRRATALCRYGKSIRRSMSSSRSRPKRKPSVGLGIARRSSRTRRRGASADKLAPQVVLVFVLGSVPYLPPLALACVKNLLNKGVFLFLLPHTSAIVGRF